MNEIRTITMLFYQFYPSSKSRFENWIKARNMCIKNVHIIFDHDAFLQSPTKRGDLASDFFNQLFQTITRKKYLRVWQLFCGAPEACICACVRHWLNTHANWADLTYMRPSQMHSYNELDRLIILKQYIPTEVDRHAAIWRVSQSASFARISKEFSYSSSSSKRGYKRSTLLNVHWLWAS